MHYPTAKANDKEQKAYRKALRNNMTPAEATLWNALKGRGAGGLKFRRQQSIGPFILDFFCPEHRIGIEIDGTSHDYKYEYDEKRTKYLHGQGIRILRFSNQQVFTSIEAVLTEIVSAAKEDTDPTPTPPLQGRGAAALDAKADDYDVTPPAIRGYEKRQTTNKRIANNERQNINNKQ